MSNQFDSSSNKQHKSGGWGNQINTLNSINNFGEDGLEKCKNNFEKNFEIMMKKSLSAVRSKCADYNFYVKNNYNKLLI
jgi:hypothetical protein